VRATARVNKVNAETVLKVLRVAGQKAGTILNRELRNIKASQISVDEAWTFVQKKARRVTENDHPDHGDQWIFLAITEDKLIPAFALGKRDPHTAFEFLAELQKRIDGRFQLTSDGWRVYQTTIETIFGADIDYAQEIKDYGQMESSRERYSPSDLKAVERKAISGRPNLELASTAYIERANLTLRTKMRRATRLASGFSKKKAYLAAALALHIFVYNFATIHSTIKCTPAQQSNITDKVWNWADLFAN
jgi:IS1 family transposase